MFAGILSSKDVHTIVHRVQGANWGCPSHVHHMLIASNFPCFKVTRAAPIMLGKSAH